MSVYIWKADNLTAEPHKVECNSKEKIIQVTVGLDYFAMVTEMRKLLMFGSNSYGQLGNNTRKDPNNVIKIMENVEMVCCGTRHTAAIDFEGIIWLWGDNRQKQCVYEDTECILKPRKLSFPAKIKYVDLSSNFSACVDENGNLYVWGSKEHTGLKIVPNIGSHFAIDKTFFGGKDVLKVSCGEQHTLALVRTDMDKLRGNICFEKVTKSKSAPEDVRISYEHDCSSDRKRMLSAGSLELLEQFSDSQEKEQDYFADKVSQILSVVPQRPRQVALGVMKTLRNSFSTTQAPSQPIFGVRKCCPLQISNSCDSIPKLIDKTMAETPTLETNVVVHTEVWCWGKGQYGQLGQGDQIDRDKPVRIRSLINKCVIDMKAGNRMSLVLTADGTVFRFGNDLLTPTQINLQTPATGISLTSNCSFFIMDAPKFATQLWVLKKSGLMQSSSPDGKGRIRQMSSCPFEGRTAAAIIENDEHKGIYELAVTERHFLTSLVTVRTHLITPIINSDAYGTFKEQTYDGQAFERLLAAYNETIDRVRTLCVELSEICSLSRTIEHLSLTTEHSKTFEEYGILYDNCLALGSVHSLSSYCKKAIEEANLKVKDVLKRTIGPTNVLIFALTLPLRRSGEYGRLCSKIASNFPPNSSKHVLFAQIAEIWANLKRSTSERHNIAEITRKFWLSSKISESLRCPDRRVLKEGDKNELVSQNAGRFFSRSFILFNDILVDAGYGNLKKYNLTTLWLEEDLDEPKNIVLVTPEERIVLCANKLETRNSWLKILQHSVIKALGYEGRHIPVVRNATYEFDKKKKGVYKGATYTGNWIQGKMHGTGSMIWPDGRVLNGFWSNSLSHGFCEERVPDSNGNLMHYKGDFLQDKKEGYGVLDSGNERYLGEWKNDVRHGKGMTLTLDGRCVCGTWKDDRLNGDCVILYENDSQYTGQVNLSVEPNGQGIFELDSGLFPKYLFRLVVEDFKNFLFEGYTLDGTFGPSSEGLEVHGVLTFDPTKKKMTDVRDKIKYPPFYISAKQKWNSIWRELEETFALDDDLEPIPELSPEELSAHAWRCVERCAEGAPSHQKILSRNPLKSSISSLTGEDIDVLSDYLNAVIDTTWHPLGIAMRRLVSAFRLSYTGIGCHPAIMLRVALSEIADYSKRFVRLILPLFPQLPPTLPDEPGIIDEDTIITADNLVHPLLVPRIYTSLFALHALVVGSEEDDVRYWKKVITCSKLQHKQLSAALGVAERLQSVTCESAAECLQRLPTAFSIYTKFDVLQRTFQLLTDEVRSASADSTPMDDLLPLVEMTVVKAKIRHLGAEILFMERLMEDHIMHGEKGILLTTLSASYLQLQNEI